MPLCRRCQKPFKPNKYGPTKIFCSRKCVQREWEAKPENQTKKTQRNRKRKLAKYGWTPEQVQQELIRQNYVCYGCLKPITEKTARIDHCHKENRVRGLLCDSCNWTLGHASDSQSTLRRLMAYLDRKRERVLIYLIGALKNTRIPEIGNLLRAEGFDVMDEWCTPGPEADINWQKYEKLRGRTYKEALYGRSAINTFLFDRSYLDLADIVIFVAPAGKSAMLELGYARGKGKPGFIYLDGVEPDRYDVMPAAATAVLNTEEELIETLRNFK